MREEKEAAACITYFWFKTKQKTNLKKTTRLMYSNNFKEYKLYKGRTKKYVYRDSDITMISILCRLVITGRNKVEELVI